MMYQNSNSNLINELEHLDYLNLLLLSGDKMTIKQNSTNWQDQNSTKISPNSGLDYAFPSESEKAYLGKPGFWKNMTSFDSLQTSYPEQPRLNLENERLSASFQNLPSNNEHTPYPKYFMKNNKFQTQQDLLFPNKHYTDVESSFNFNDLIMYLKNKGNDSYRVNSSYEEQSQKAYSSSSDFISENSFPSPVQSKSGMASFITQASSLERPPINFNNAGNSNYSENKNFKFVNKLLPSLTKRLEKTQLCKHFSRNQKCPNGLNCAFAHSLEELRSRPDLTKTKICSDFQLGICRAGANCKHAHSDSELKATPEFYKTSLCPDFTFNFNCNRGSNCRFAHSEFELNRIY